MFWDEVMVKGRAVGIGLRCLARLRRAEQELRLDELFQESLLSWRKRSHARAPSVPGSKAGLSAVSS